MTEKMYVIHWKILATGQDGHGFPLTRETANDYMGIVSSMYSDICEFWLEPEEEIQE